MRFYVTAGTEYNNMLLAVAPLWVLSLVGRSGSNDVN
jgi:hypothetical protein